ncbi:M23 family metallopeptidase [Pseudonocardia sp. ICBG1293]|uniref:M23 family metallopeptidase n=1 Tax=Pseudonocardia sp. ICBG1293 TaxID=2844382 RepID=UPI001CC8F7FA|nr:M23 family metallopeptidase [Pseudonocardia sp. ICBG1293]
MSPTARPAPPTRTPRRTPRPGWRVGARVVAVLLAVVVTGTALLPPGAAVAEPVREPPGAADVEPVRGPPSPAGPGSPGPGAVPPGAALPDAALPDAALPDAAPPDAAPPGPGPAAPGSPEAARPAPVPPRPPGAGIPAPGADYSWPLLPPPAVTAVFRKPAFRYGRGHRGADLAGVPGQAVLVAREGVVVFAGAVAGRGVVSVDHPDGLRSTYEPVTAAVVAGARLAGGDPVGSLEPGHAGCPTEACLHWGVRRERLDHLDPLVLLRPPRVRLLPWAGAPEPAGPAPGVSPPVPAATTPAAG